jgi:hypothetical protein
MGYKVDNMKAGHGILADFFAGSHIQLHENKEAKGPEAPKAFGAENERECHVLSRPVVWML